MTIGRVNKMKDNNDEKEDTSAEKLFEEEEERATSEIDEMKLSMVGKIWELKKKDY